MRLDEYTEWDKEKGGFGKTMDRLGCLFTFIPAEKESGLRTVGPVLTFRERTNRFVHAMMRSSRKRGQSVVTNGNLLFSCGPVFYLSKR